MKKIIATGLFAIVLTCASASVVYCADDSRIEHLNYVQNAKTNIVRISNQGRVILRDNMLEVSFSENFNSKYYKRGDMIQFDFQEAIITDEGSILIPKGSSLVASIEEIKPPRWFSRNARVTLDFAYILLPKGKKVPLKLELANGKGYLAKGPTATAGKIAAYTLTIGGTGAGLGAAIGTASSNTIPGLIIGGSVGGGVGLLTGIFTPGLDYKVKKGTIIPIRFKDDFIAPKL